MNQKLRVVLVFGFVGLLLAAWTVKILVNKEQETALVAAVMAAPVNSDFFIEQYKPYTDAEMTDLKERVDVSSIDNQTILVVTRKPSFYQTVQAWVDDDYSNIWAPDCYELRKLILQHDVSMQTYEPGQGKLLYMVIDNGKVYAKPSKDVAQQFKTQIVYDRCGDLKFRSFGSGRAAPMHTGY